MPGFPLTPGCRHHVQTNAIGRILLGWYRMHILGKLQKNTEIMPEAGCRKIRFLVYLIMLAPTPVNQMEIVSPAKYRRQQRRKAGRSLSDLGAAIGMDEAKRSREIVADVYRLSGDGGVKGIVMMPVKVKKAVRSTLEKHDLLTRKTLLKSVYQRGDDENAGL